MAVTLAQVDAFGRRLHFQVNKKYWVTYDNQKRHFNCDCVGNATFKRLCKHIKEVIKQHEIPDQYVEELEILKS